MTDSIFPAGAEPILPILPLRNSVLFPATVVPVNVGRARSVRLIEEAWRRERQQQFPGTERFWQLCSAIHAANWRLRNASSCSLYAR